MKLPDGNWSDWIGSSVIHRSLGILIIRIGDFKTETALLDPLRKSVLQFFRLLLTDDMVRAFDVRTLTELKHVWDQNHGGFTHVVLIGHGDRNKGVCFANSKWKKAHALNAVFRSAAAKPKTIVSLCCETGYANVAQTISEMDYCENFVAPFHSVHGAIASQFCQSFFTYILLQGESIGNAFRHARDGTPGAKIFRHWVDGEMVAGAR